jgi:cell division protein FtsW
MPDKKVKLKSGDFALVALVSALVIFGVVMVFSSSSYTALAEEGDGSFYLKRVCVMAAIGFAAMFAAAAVPISVYYKLAPVAAALSLVLLLLVFTSLGEERNGAARWLSLGGMTVMPGELAKPAAILFMARFLGGKPGRERSLYGVAASVVICGAFALPIYKQPNLSTAIIVAAVIMGMMFVAGVNLAALSGIVIAVGVALAHKIFSEDGYQADRVASFLDPFENMKYGGWQGVHSLMGLGTGGVFGVGLGKGIQKTLYLPEVHNDFILSVVGEELGFAGCLVLLVVYLALIFRGAYIAIKAPDRFSMLLASGITIMFALQVVMHCLVVTSWMPPTGVTLPFVSYGGNALVIYMGMAGILLNVSRRAEAQEDGR